MVRIELLYARQGRLIGVVTVVSDHRHGLRIRHFHRHRDLNVLFANLFDNFRALLLVTVAFHNLVIVLALLLERLHALLLRHIHSGRKALGGDSEKNPNQSRFPLGRASKLRK